MFDGAIAYVHPSDCMTVIVRPATTSVPDRPGPSLAATRTTTMPGPVPLAPLVIVIQVA
jgi:hypothetical protein